MKSPWDQTMMYRRDASWHSTSKPTAQPLVYHFPNPEDPALAACSSRIALLEDGETSPLEVRAADVCKRSACRKRYDAAQPRKR